jgi:putative membrane protein
VWNKFGVGKGENNKMRYGKALHALILGGIATVAIGAFMPSTAGAQKPATAGVSALLNKANAINYAEIEMAKMAHNKAGDNQAMLTFAKTMQDDHQANEDAVTALSRQKNIKIEGTPASIDEKEKQLDNLNGGQFNEAFLKEAIVGHTEALRYFEIERAKFKSDPDVYLYVEETIPVVRAHLEMARSMKQQLGRNSQENPENNKHDSNR